MARRTYWSEESVAALLNIWADESIKRKLDGTSKKKPVYRDIAMKIKDECGEELTDLEVKNKIRNMTREYRKFKDQHNRSGAGRKPPFKYEKELDNILGDKATTRPVFTMDTSRAEEDEDFAECSSQDTEEESDEEAQACGQALKRTIEEEEDDDDDDINNTQEIVVKKAPKLARKSGKKKSKADVFKSLIDDAVESFSAKSDSAMSALVKLEQERLTMERTAEARHLDAMRAEREAQRKHELQMMQLMAQMMGGMASAGGFQSASTSSSQTNAPGTSSARARAREDPNYHFLYPYDASNDKYYQDL
ncbi:uncharacterized protein LOC106154218 [Lingula anatina]|uniref:Uncharacterized protein LOC106154218 n=1 Tax=Lingula anatina TaxID=7574 RepID=A0A1S3HFY2_LINAN|nr:uncharacterized protein LOC106154218 [Lingula anatina]|eukprot:XP_013383944.1 uncharacterized protein LOC106154218 [Lingula anatina]